MAERTQRIKIAELARISGIARSTIHHYGNLGLLPPPEVHGPKLHLFGALHIARLREIKRLRAQGLSLRAIKPLLPRPASAKPAPKADATRDPTRRRILERAAELFLSLGYERMRLDDLASELQMAKATIYRHFASKQSLFLECVELIRFTLIPKAMRDKSEQQPQLEAQARDRSRAILEHFRAYRGLASLLSSLVHDPDPQLAERASSELHSIITNAEPFLRLLQSLGRIRAIDSELLAYMLWGALMGAGERLTRDQHYSLDQVLETYLDFIAHGTYAGGLDG